MGQAQKNCELLLTIVRRCHDLKRRSKARDEWSHRTEVGERFPHLLAERPERRGAATHVSTRGSGLEETIACSRTIAKRRESHPKRGQVQR